MLTKNLARLKELDPAAYDQIMLGIPIGPRGMYLTYDMGERRAHQYKETYVSFVTLPHEAQSAWLQWCLQEAIAARGWPFQIVYYPPEGDISPHYKSYMWPGVGCLMRRADTPPAALLAAYIAALEAQA